MFQFEPTTDPELIRSIFTNPKVWPWITDDFTCAPDQWEPTIHPSIIYLLAKAGNGTLGIWMFHPHNTVCYEVHTVLLKAGKRGIEAAKLAAEWMWANTPARRIITNVPRYNRIALKFAEAAGMRQYGINEVSIMRGGKLHDQILLGISKPEVSLCPPQ